MQRWLQLAERGAFGEPVRFTDRQEIISIGGPVECAYLFAEGHGEIFQSDASGRALVVKLIQAPAFPASHELFAGEARHLSGARAANAAACYRVDRHALFRTLRGDHQALYELCVNMTRAFVSSVKTEPARLLGYEEKLAGILSSYCACFGKKKQGWVAIDIRRTQLDFAQMVGAGERTINRILGRWQKEGWLRKEDGIYWVQSEGHLDAAAPGLSQAFVHTWRGLPPTPL